MKNCKTKAAPKKAAGKGAKLQAPKKAKATKAAKPSPQPVAIAPTV